MNARRAIPLVLPLLLGPVAARAQVASLQPDSARQCAVCHVSWADAFNQPGVVTLIDKPPASRVSADETCLGCHDASVADSRTRVWLEHGHKTGVAPPDDMKVPDLLPLDDGKIACRTCHTAHGAGVGPETLASTVFLRVPNDTSQLCHTCHADYVKGPELGTHPLTDLPFAMPPELVAAGAQAGPKNDRIICQTCHTPHGAREDRLLVRGTQTGQLCQTCHERLRPTLWRPDVTREHPQNPPLSSDAQRNAIHDMGTKTGAGDTLICLSCHKVHNGLAGRYMLADTLENSRLCIRCHPDRATLFGTGHDLRTSAPSEQNRLGQTPQQSGPCGACHSFHQFARRPAPETLDPTGFCATCHREGECAQKATGLPFSHPAQVEPENMTALVDLVLYADQPGRPRDRLACLTCHNPHDTKHPHFLRDESDRLCATCHADKADSLTGPHDFTDRPELVNARGKSAAQAGKCGFCHGVHDALSPAMWVATDPPPRRLDDWCLVCHREEGLAGKPAPQLRHPTGPATRGKLPANAASLPLFNPQGHLAPDGMLACASCHDPHGGSGGKHLVRMAQDADTDAFCLDCHADMKTIAASMHRDEVLASNDVPTQFCGPCHRAHAKPGMPPDGMWAGPLGPKTLPQDVRECVGCHSAEGFAEPITPFDHPAVGRAMVAAEADDTLKLLPDPTLGDAAGRIACATCHLPHGSTITASHPQAPAESARLLQALKPMLRPYNAPNLCTACHGYDGLLRFLYVHAPQKRTPLDDASRPPPDDPVSHLNGATP